MATIGMSVAAAERPMAAEEQETYATSEVETPWPATACSIALLLMPCSSVAEEIAASTLACAVLALGASV